MVVMVLAVGAWARPALDYVAPEECPDAGRFSDEVSARIGAQAFGGESEVMVIRLAQVGSEVVGTLGYGEGSRMVRGATCAEVVDGLVVAAATLLDARLTPVPEPTAPPAPSAAMVKVTLDSTKPGVTVARVTGWGTDPGTGAQVTFYEDLCIAPCSFEVPRGLNELHTYGPRLVPISGKFQLEADTRLRARLVSSGPRGLFGVLMGLGIAIGGLGASITGTCALADCDDFPTLRSTGVISLGAGVFALGTGLGVTLALDKSELTVIGESEAE